MLKNSAYVLMALIFGAIGFMAMTINRQDSDINTQGINPLPIDDGEIIKEILFQELSI